MDGHLPSPWWSPTIPRMVTQHSEYGHPLAQGWLTYFRGMLTHHQQCTAVCSPIFPWIVTQKDGHLPKDGQLTSPGWSPTIARSAIQSPKDGHQQSMERSPLSPGWSTDIHMMVKHHLQDGHPQQVGWSNTIPRRVNQKRSLTLAQPSMFFNCFPICFCQAQPKAKPQLGWDSLNPI